jgi:propanol-preferring alcohol dehydrogenase
LDRTTGLTRWQPKEVSIPFEEYIFRDVRVKGSFLCSQKEAEEMLQCVVDHDIHIEKNIFHGLDQVPTAVEALKTGAYRGKGVIVIEGA